MQVVKTLIAERSKAKGPGKVSYPKILSVITREEAYHVLNSGRDIVWLSNQKPSLSIKNQYNAVALLLSRI